MKVGAVFCLEGMRSKSFRQPSLPQDGICGVAARDADRHRKIPPRNGAMPDFVAAFSLSNQHAAGIAQKISQWPVKLRRHSSCRRFGFP
jgi:hypothetical protein